MPCPCPPRPQHGGSGAHVNPPLPSTLLRTGAAPYTHGSRPICRAEHPQFQHLLPFSLESVDRTLDPSRHLSAPAIRSWRRRASRPGVTCRPRRALARRCTNQPSVWSRSPSPCAPAVRPTGKKDTHGDERSRPRARDTRTASRSVAGAPWALPQRTPAARPRADEYVYVRPRIRRCKSPELPAGWGRGRVRYA